MWPIPVFLFSRSKLDDILKNGAARGVLTAFAFPQSRILAAP
jgi:hypothetical protein